MENHEVWLEGYVATGNSKGADFLGCFDAPTFQEACVMAIKKRGMDISYYDENSNTFWGCRFFDNAKEATAKFG